jgi:hypothetical protein
MDGMWKGALDDRQALKPSGSTASRAEGPQARQEGYPSIGLGTATAATAWPQSTPTFVDDTSSFRILAFERGR